MGTVLAGAITTGGSAMFMFFCQMTFFFKMAVLIVMTILMSFIFSLGYFMAMIYVFGPQGSAGRFWCVEKKRQPAAMPPVAFNQNETELAQKEYVVESVMIVRGGS